MSKKLNLLALPKSPDFMKCFISPPGMKLIQTDCAAVEPRTLTHFSQDPMLMKIYGPDAFPGMDIYLIAGMSVPGIGEEVAAIYDVNNPTTESIALAKKTFAKERKLWKAGYLGWQYGIGPETLATNLEISFPDASRILKAFDKRFCYVEKLQERLAREWVRNNGFIINGRGRPLCVDFSKKKDLVSRIVQSSAHDVLTRISWHLNNYRKEHKLTMRPVVADWHDEFLWAAPEDEIDKASAAITYAFDRINDELAWSVQITNGGINVGDSFAIRCDE